MPKRVPLETIVVGRPKGFPDNKKEVKDDNGKVVQEAYTPPLNQPFMFTAEEIEQIERVNPAALGTVAEVDVTTENPAPASTIVPATSSDPNNPQETTGKVIPGPLDGTGQPTAQSKPATGSVLAKSSSGSKTTKNDDI